MSEAIQSLLKGLSNEQQARLLASITTISTEATKRYGCTPTLDEVAALAQVRAMTLNGVQGDIENALFQLKNEAESVVNHLAQSEKSGLDAIQLGEGFAKTGIISAEDLTNLQPAYAQFLQAGWTGQDIVENIKDPSTRAAVGRALAVPIELRQGSNLSMDTQSFTDSKSLDQLTPAEKMERARQTEVKS